MLQPVVLQCSAINSIDASALDSLEAIERRLREAGIALHLSEVKGPVMDRLQFTEFVHDLSGKIFPTHYQAIASLTPELLLGLTPRPVKLPLYPESRGEPTGPPRPPSEHSVTP